MQPLVGAPEGSAGVKTQRRGKGRVEDPIVPVFLRADGGQTYSWLDGSERASSGACALSALHASRMPLPNHQD